MNSYQRLKRKNAYLEQRQVELEDILHDIDKELGKQGIKIIIPPTLKPISGDGYLTDINTGNAEFFLHNIAGTFI